MLLMIGLSAILPLAFLIAVAIVESYKIVSNESFRFVEEMSSRYKNEINTNFTEKLVLLKSLSTSFGKYKELPEHDRRNIISLQIKSALESNPDIVAAWAQWEPGAIEDNPLLYKNTMFDVSNGGFNVTWYRMKKEIIQGKISEEAYKSDFYTKPKNKMKACLIDPYHYSYTGKKEDEIMETSICIPIISNGNFKGVIGLDISLEGYKKIISDIRFLKTGYAYLISNNGILIAHPSKDLVGKNIMSELIYEKQAEIINKIKEGKHFVIDKKSILTGKNSLQFYYPINIGYADNPWYLIFVLPTEEISSSADKLFIFLIIMGILTMTVVFISIFLASKRLSSPITELTINAEKFASGDFSTRVNNKKNDEIGRLALSFNYMAEHLQNILEEYNNINKILQIKNEKLRNSEERYRNILTKTPVIIHIVNKEGIITLSEGNGLERLNLKSDELTGKSIFSYKKFPDLLNDTTKALKGENFITLTKLNGIIFETHYSPYFNENKEFIGTLGVAFDITERIKAEEKLKVINTDLEEIVNKRTEQLLDSNKKLSETNSSLDKVINDLKIAQNKLILSEKMATLGIFGAGIAHEVNTPLGAIVSSNSTIINIINDKFPIFLKFYAELSKKERNTFSFINQRIIENIHKELIVENNNEREEKKYYENILKQENILNFDDYIPYIINLNLQDNIKKIIPVLKKDYGETFLQNLDNIQTITRSLKIIEVAVGKASNVISALKYYTHDDKIGEKNIIDINNEIDIILTLYYNKIKHNVKVVKFYSENVNITGYRDQINQIWVNLINNSLYAMQYNGILEIKTESIDDFIKVSITDSGCGIPDEHKDKIFTPFFTTKIAGEGTGLGLDLVKKIVEKHNGKIEFDSIPGKTTFFVWLKK